MERLFLTLSDREDEVAQMIGAGLEAKEVANICFRSVATIRNQMQSIYAKLKVRNRSELSVKMMEAKFNVKLTMDFAPITRTVVACCLLCVFSFSSYHEQSIMRRSRRVRIENVIRYRRYDGYT
jgi:DNA-binding CsgD family transcriptional regulator